MKKITLNLMYIMSIGLLLNSVQLLQSKQEVNVEKNISLIQKYETDIDEETTIDSVLVSIKNEKKLKNNKYSVKDFAGIGVNNVSDLSIDYADDNQKILKLQLEKGGKTNLINAIEKLEKRADIEFVEPNYKGQFFTTTPNDVSTSDDKYIEHIELDKAWKISKGLSEVKVGIIDTGISGTHYDLKNRIDKSLSINYSPNARIGNSADAIDPEYFHGTFVAGIVGATGNNSYGSAGVSWGGISLVSLRVDGPREGVEHIDYGDLKPYEEDIAAVIASIKYAKSKNIPILNFSGGFTYDSDFLYDAITDYPGLFICAAGNNDNNIEDENKMIYPAVYNLSNMITVGAATNAPSSNAKKYSSSNYSKNKVHLFAPGDNIRGSLINGEYMTGGETSSATPIVTGVAALMKAVDPTLSTIQIKNAILNNVDKNENLSNYCTTGGIINAYKAVKSIIPTYLTMGREVNSRTTLPSGEYHWFKFNAAKGVHKFETIGNLNTSGTLFPDAEPVGQLASSNEGGNGNNFAISHNFTVGKTVFIRIKNEGNSSGNYKLKITSPKNEENIDIDVPIEGVINQSSPFQWYKFVAPVTTAYTFYSTNYSSNAHATLYDENDVCIANDINGDPMNFKVECNLNRGQIVYLKVKGYYDSIGSYTLKVSMVGRPEIFISADSSTTGILNADNPFQWYKFVVPQTGYYIFGTSQSVNVSATLYDENDNSIASDINGDPMNFTIYCNLYRDQIVYLKVRPLHEYGSSYNLNVSCLQEITPLAYDFEEQYYFEEQLKTINSRGISIDTNRLRCGYISDKYLTLSVNRKGAGTAFIEYTFPQVFSSINLEIALWSATENITDKSADIVLEYKDENGDWIVAHDFSIAEMSKSKDSLDQHYFSFAKKVTSIRLYATTTNTGGDNNKGRIVIGNIVVS